MDKYIPRVGMLGTRHVHKYKYTDTQMQVYRCTDTIAQHNIYTDRDSVADHEAHCHMSLYVASLVVLVSGQSSTTDINTMNN